MKSQQRIVNLALACLLVGTSGAALAQTVTCVAGNIENTTVERIVIDGRSCYIHNVIVTGTVEVTNSEKLIMIDNEVTGTVRIQGGRDVLLVSNRARSIVVRNNDDVTALLNGARKSIVVSNNDKALVKRNIAVITISCRNNRRLDAFENEAADVDCRAFGQ